MSAPTRSDAPRAVLRAQSSRPREAAVPRTSPARRMKHSARQKKCAICGGKNMPCCASPEEDRHPAHRPRSGPDRDAYQQRRGVRRQDRLPENQGSGGGSRRRVIRAAVSQSARRVPARRREHSRNNGCRKHARSRGPQEGVHRHPCGSHRQAPAGTQVHSNRRAPGAPRQTRPNTRHAADAAAEPDTCGRRSWEISVVRTPRPRTRRSPAGRRSPAPPHSPPPKSVACGGHAGRKSFKAQKHPRSQWDAPRRGRSWAPTYAGRC